MTPLSADPAAALLRARAAYFAAETARFARDQVLSTVSHDLRGPLNAMHSWAYVLERQLAHADANVLRALAGIRTGIEQQTKLIETQVDAPRAATRALALDCAAVAPAELAQQAAALARLALADARGTPLEIEPAPDLAAIISADGERLAQALFAMLTYAAEAGAPHRTVTLAASSDAATLRFEVRFTVHRDALVDAALPHLLEAFAREQALQVQDAKRGAWALGLCLRVAQAHGGAFAQDPLVDGAPSTLALTLPRTAVR
ncbi:sensor histidine kinase [Burkholderia sp. FERM BP-3421]|uniref:sensor histidine kinase n=1 Tax=Burkholderia sp. FERM BP-3421 TaxID=1494466 RepID=UPI00235E0BFB|nr:sensor histidine kinase [Burkholderia sp. FERM BP-3421]WDD92865.1 sensor histidine kinase [Burkholderia sp. FERM BP-3421]